MTTQLSSQAHPHGRSIHIMNVIEEGGSKKFITETENIDKIFLHPEVKDRKIVVLSIIGAYRKGKSFFLDYCLRFLYANYRSVNNMDESKPIAGDWIGDGNTPLQGFSWKHGRNPDTKGIILWSDVFLHDTPTEKIAIVVMDTQGLFEPRSTNEENGRIFGLSTLLSSIQILNIKDVLQENQFEHLEMATTLSKIITNKNKSTKWKPFQKLLFLFRDRAGKDVGFGFDGGEKYLNKTILKEKGNKNAKVNVIRKNIRASFDKISCFILNNPGLKINEGHGEWSTLEKSFITNLELLIESLLSPKNLVNKSNLGKDLTAEEFQALIKIYLNVFANAKLPKAANILQLAIDNQMQNIVNAQLKFFNQLQAELNVDYDREDFVDWVNEVHENNTKTAVDGFLNAEKLDDEESLMKFEKIMKKEIEIVFMNWKQTIMKVYEEFQEQKREIDDCFKLQVKNYQEIMSTDIDFNQDDFEKYYEDLHKSTVANANQELEKIKFKDEASKIISVKSLEDKLRENYSTLKDSQIKEFDQHLKNVSLLADSQFKDYKNNLNAEIDYENNDFESYINEKHLTAKKAAIDGLKTSKLAFTPRKAQFEENLSDQIDSEYLTCKETAIKIKEKYQDKEYKTKAENFSNDQVRSFHILNIIEEGGEKKFITETENIDKIFLHPEVKDRKIVVLSIIGAYRKGKSFFLGYCLRFLYAKYRSVNNMDEEKPIAGDWIGDGNEQLQGFSWKHGSTPDTKGIKIWSDVFLHDTETEKIAIVVMDTQGLFETGSTAEENGRIFGLSTLLSSIQILNIKDVIQEDQLEYLDMATNLAQIIIKKQKLTQWKPFQKLLFLFRDYAYEDYELGYEGGQQYLNKTVLKEKGDENRRANVVRRNIRGSFDEILCFLMSNPGLAVTKEAFKGEWSKLEKPFISNLENLIKTLFLPQNLVKKTILGNAVTADEFQDLIKIYFKAFANAKLPETDNILQMAIDNQFKTIVNAQLKVFNQLQADLNVDYDREDFVDWVDEVYENNTKTAVDGFLNAEKLDDEESLLKFKEILKVEIGITFENWNQTTMNAYEEFQEQKRQREINDCFNLQLKAYQQIMNTNIDFNQDDFEKYYEDLHKATMENATRELEKMRFKDENEKLNVTKSLEDKLSEIYETLKDSKVKEFDQHLNSVSMLTDSQFKDYKNDLNLNLNYEHENFESYIKEKHLTAKNAAIDGLENSQKLTFKPRKAQFEEKLIANIDEEFLTWKEATMKNYEELQEQKRQIEIEKCSNFHLLKHQKVMSTNLDFNQDDFEKYYEDLHKTTVANATEELEKIKFKDEASKISSVKSLEDKLLENHETLKDSQIKEFDQHLKNVSLLADSQFKDYKNNLNAEIDYENKDFESYINEKHLTAKNAAIDGLENSKELTFKPRKAQFEEKLIAQIDSEYLTWKEANLKIYEDSQEKKRQIEIEKCSNFHLLNHQKVMSTDLDFNQDDFEKYYEDLHKTTVANANQELEKIKFKDEASKISSVKSLEDKLRENYEPLKTSKNNEYNHYLKVVSMLVDAQFDAYKIKLTQDFRYENHTDFEGYIDKKNLTAKTTSIEGFDNSQQLTFAPRKVHFKEKLIAKIDSEYLTWKEANLKIYEKFRDQKNQTDIEIFSNRQVINYQQNMSTNLDFNQDDFEKYYEALHKSTMANATRELEKKKFKNEIDKVKSSKILEDRLIEIYETLKTSKMAEFNQHLRVVAMLVDSQLEAYKNIFNSNIDYERQNFESYINEKHLNVKNVSVKGFENSQKLTFTPRKNQFKEELIERINSEYQTWKERAMEINEKFLDHKHQTEIEKLSSLQVSNYQQVMSTNLDFNQDDFEKYYEYSHKTAVNIAVRELEKMKFKDEASKSDSIKSLEDRLSEIYATLNDSKVKEFTQHLNSVSMLADSQFKDYKNNLNLSLDFENKEFEKYINEKHLTAKNAAIDGLENSKELTFKPRKAQFKIELIAKVDSEFLTWKEAAMKNYEEFQNKKHQTVIEKCLNLQPKIYRKIMSTNIDFNQDDFEKYYEDLHKSTVENAFKELHKLKFKDEESKNVFTKLLEDELDDIYSTLKFSAISEFNRHLKDFSSLVDSQFKAYKNDLNLNLDNENEDFEKYINEKHLTAKRAAVDGFKNSQQLTFTPRKAQFKEELIAKIDSEFKAWKDLTLKAYEKKQDEKLSKIFKLKREEYKNSLDLDIDYNRENFLDFLNARHKTDKEKVMKKFIEETNFLNNKAKQTMVQSQLEDNIDNIFTGWFNDRKTECEKFLQDRIFRDDYTLNIIYEKILQKYKDMIEKINCGNSKYESLITTMHEGEKESAIVKFLSETRNVQDRTSVEKKIPVLKNAMEDFKVQQIKTYNDLRTVGIWVPWDGSKSGIPKYAVEGGYDGGKLYFARAEIEGGKFIGKFKSGDECALIAYNWEEKSFSSFEIFTHTNCKFVWKVTSKKIVGGYYSNGTDVFMARTSKGYFKNDVMIPGTLFGDNCRITKDGKVDRFAYYYETLVLA